MCITPFRHVFTASLWAALAWCGRSSHIQAWADGVQVLDVADRVTYKLGVTVYKCSMWQIESHTSLGWRCTSACMAGTGLSVWAVYTGRSSWWTTASSFRQQPSTRCCTVSAQYVRPSHLRCRWTNDMELVPKQFAWAGHANWLFSSYTEDVSFWSVLGTFSTLEALFVTMRYINWHLHLHLSIHIDFLRSFSQHHLISVGYMRTVSSSRCYKHSAATNWNDLPYDIRDCSSVSVFKRKLKSYLFSIAYIAQSHVTPVPTNNFFCYIWRFIIFFLLYCIVHCISLYASESAV